MLKSPENWPEGSSRGEATLGNTKDMVLQDPGCSRGEQKAKLFCPSELLLFNAWSWREVNGAAAQ